MSTGIQPPTARPFVPPRKGMVQFGNFPTLDELDVELSERYLRDFVESAWPILEPTTQFVGNWHIDAICEHLQAVTEGYIKDLIINIPPAHMKSLTVSVFWPAWEWGPYNNPSSRWLYSSYRQSLATRDSVRCRRVIQSWWYYQRWADRFKLTGDQNAKNRFDNNKTGYRIAASVIGGATGERGNRIVVDDPHEIMQSESDDKREHIHDWWDHVMSSRRNDVETSSRVIIQQRVHDDDLSGHVRERGYTVLSLPEEFDPKRKCSTYIDGKLFFEDPRKAADALLWPRKFPPAKVEEIRKDLGSWRFAGLYNQDPAPREGGIFHKDWWQYWEEEDLPERFDVVIASWDMTFVGTDTSDFVAGHIWAAKDADRYLLYRSYDRRDYVQTKEEVIRVSKLFPEVKRTYVEDKANGPAILSDLKKVVSGLLPFSPNKYGSKESRASAVSAQVESGNVYLPHPRKAPWVDAMVDTFRLFPKVKHDDDVDAMTQALLKLDDLMRRGTRIKRAPIVSLTKPGIEV